MFVKLDLSDAMGAPVSDNFYWYSAQNSGYRDLDNLAPAHVSASALATRAGNGAHLMVLLTNRGSSVALTTKLTVLNAADQRVLPAYYSDNYVSLLPGEAHGIRIDCPHPGAGPLEIGLRGWNLRATTIRPKSAAGSEQPIPSS